MSGTLVTGNFFSALGVSAALGRMLTPADDDRSAPQPVVVLSHRGWTRHFDASRRGRGPAAVLINGSPYRRRRRDAGRLSWAGRQRAGLLGAARAPWPVPADSPGARRLGRHRGRRTAAARAVAVGRGSPQLGVWDARAGFSRQRGHADERARSRCRDRARSRCPAEVDAAVHAALLCLRADPDDRVRERRQPAARARRVAPARNRHPAVDWRVTRAASAAVAHRECLRSRSSLPRVGYVISRLVLVATSTP